MQPDETNTTNNNPRAGVGDGREQPHVAPTPPILTPPPANAKPVSAPDGPPDLRDVGPVDVSEPLATGPHEDCVPKSKAATASDGQERIGSYLVHPAAKLVRKQTKEERESLRASVLKIGITHPIALFHGRLLDGRNRLEIALELGIEPPVIELDPSIDPYEYSRSVNLARRHLSPTERAFLAAEEATLRPGEKGNAAPAATQDEAAKRHGVSPDSIQRARKVLANGCDNLNEAVRNGFVSLATAAKWATYAYSTQERLLSDPKTARKKARTKKRGHSPLIIGGIQAERRKRHVFVPLTENWKQELRSILADEASVERFLKHGITLKVAGSKKVRTVAPDGVA